MLLTKIVALVRPQRPLSVRNETKSEFYLILSYTELTKQKQLKLHQFLAILGTEIWGTFAKVAAS